MTHCITMCVTQFRAANMDRVSNLAYYLDSISEAIDNKKQVDSVYLDSVCHSLTINSQA